MVPKAVICKDCGQTAEVHACGRIEYDWPKTTAGGSVATMPIINSIRLTIDCPNCGVKQQDFPPERISELNPAIEPFHKVAQSPDSVPVLLQTPLAALGCLTLMIAARLALGTKYSALRTC